MAVSLLLFCVEPHLSQHVLPASLARGVGSAASGELEMGLPSQAQALPIPQREASI